MPYYVIQHIVPLSDDQQDRLAEAITHIHSDLFSVPRLFVNVEFSDKFKANTYIAGKRHRANRIQAIVRHGPSRTQAHYRSLTDAVEKAWHDIVGASGEQALGPIFVHGSIVAGREQGFDLPLAGGDHEWIRNNMAGFEAKAASGNQDFVDLVHEVKTRPAFSDALKASNGTA